MHPHPHQAGLILPSWWNVRQEVSHATLCTLWPPPPAPFLSPLPSFTLSVQDLWVIINLKNTWGYSHDLCHPESSGNARWQPLSDLVFSDSEMMSLLSLTITVAVLVSYTQTTFVQPARHRHLPPIQALDRSVRAEARLLEGSNLKTSPITVIYKATIRDRLD